MSRGAANLLLLLAGALWGAGFVAQSTAMEHLGPLQFIGFRFVAATIALLPFALNEGRRAQVSLGPRDWKAFGLIGCLLFAGMSAQQFGIMFTSVTNSGFLTGLYVVFAPFVAVLVYREMPHPVVWPATFVAFLGIWMLSGGDVLALSRGDWLTVACAAMWALQLAMIARHANHTGRPITLAVVQMGVCAALGVTSGLMLEPFDSRAIIAAMPEILYAGVVSGGIAFTLQAIGQRYTTTAQAALFLSSEAIFAALFAALLLGERVAPLGFVGCVLILAAIVAVEVVPAVSRLRAGTNS